MTTERSRFFALCKDRNAEEPEAFVFGRQHAMRTAKQLECEFIIEVKTGVFDYVGPWITVE